MDPLRDKNYITTKEAGELSGYSSDYLARLARSEKILGKRVGHSWFIDRESLTAFIASQGNRKIDRARALARAREEEYRTHQQVSGVQPVQVRAFAIADLGLNRSLRVSHRTHALAPSLRAHVAALIIAASVILGGAVIAQRLDTEGALAHASVMAQTVSIGFAELFGSMPAQFVAQVENAREVVRTQSSHVSSTIAFVTTSVASPTLATFDGSILRMPIAISGSVTRGALMAGKSVSLVVTLDSLRIGAQGALATLANPGAIVEGAVVMYRSLGDTLYGGILASFEAYAGMIRNAGSYALAAAEQVRVIAGYTPAFVTRMNLALGDSVIMVTHALIRADVSFAYGVAEVAPASARVVATTIGSVGSVIAGTTARIPEFAQNSFIAVTAIPANVAPRIAHAVFSTEYAAAERFVTLTSRVSEQYLALVTGVGSYAATHVERAQRDLATIRAFSVKAPAAIEDAYLGFLGTSAVALEQFSHQSMIAAVVSSVQSVTSPLIAAAAPALSTGEQVALTTFTTIRGLFDSANRGLAFLLGPAPTVVIPQTVLRTGVAVNTKNVTTSVAVSAPTYTTTIVRGVTQATLDASLASLRANLLATMAGMIQPVATQTATNATTIQYVNMIQDLSNLTVRNGHFINSLFEGGNVRNAVSVSAVDGYFDNLYVNGTKITANGNVTIIGGSGNVSTSTPEIAGQIPYWTSTNGTPATLASVATTTLTGSGGITLSGGAGSLIGGSNATISLSAIAANSLLGNATGVSGVPTAIATSTLFGTGTGGYVLAWNNGQPQWVATSSMSGGVASIAQTYGSAQNGALTFATSSQTVNGQTIGLNITNSAGAFTFAPTLSGTLSIGGGGTGLSSLSGNSILYTNSAGTAFAQVATSTLYGTGTGGQVLAWNNGVPSWVATTTFSTGLTYTNGVVTNAGLLSLQQTYGAAQTGALTFATSSATTFNGLTISNAITNSGTTFTFASPTITGTLAVAGGGTGLSAVGDGQLLFGSPSGTALTALATSTGGFLTNSYATGRPSWVATSSLNIDFANLVGTASIAQGGTATTTFYNGGVTFYNSTLGTLSQGTAQQDFFYDVTNKRLGLGSSTPSASLSIFAGGNFASQAPSTLFAIGSSSAGTATTSIMTVLSSGYVGIGSTSPTYYLTVDLASANALASANGMLVNVSNTTTGTPFSINNTAGNLAFISTGGSWSVAAALVSRSTTATSTFAGGLTVGTSKFVVNNFNNNVGIGTTTPYGLLTLYTAAATAAGSPQMVFSASSTVAGLANALTNWTIGTDLADGGKFKISSSSVVGTNDRFVIDGAGRVGIGTSSPYAALSVVGLSGVVADHYTATSTTATSTFAGFIDVNGTGSNATSTFAANLWVKGTLRTGTGSFYLNDTGLTSSDGNVNFVRSGTSYLTGGAFGVGTTSPMSLFAVQGDAYLSGNLSVANITATGTLAFTGNTSLSGATSTSFFANTLTANTFAVGQTATTSITSAGFIGVGSTSPWAMLSVNPTAGLAGAAFAVGSSSATTLVVTNTGLVGIGTAAPTALFSVNGTASTTNIIVSSAGGTAGCATFAVDGTISNTGVACGSGGSAGDPFAPRGTTFNVAMSATTSPIWLQSGANLFASSTIRFGNAGITPFIYDSAVGNLGLGTTTPRYTLQVASSTAPQLALSDGSLTSDHWTLRSSTGNLYFATSSPSTFATSSVSALSIDTNGLVSVAGTASTTALVVSSAGGTAGCATFAVDGSISNTHSTCGGSGAFPWTPTTNYGVNVNATTTALWAQAGLFASSTSHFTQGDFLNYLMIGTSSNNGLNVAQTPLQISSTTNSFLQAMIQNMSNGTAASADFIVANDKTTDGSHYYGDFGINSSNYVQNGFAGENANDVFVYSSDSNLLLETASSTGPASIKFFTSGQNLYNQRAVITETGLFGIGSTSPWAQLSVHAVATSTYTNLFAIGSSTATATTTLFVVRNNGYVGIGTSTPLGLLQVQASGSGANSYIFNDNFENTAGEFGARYVGRRARGTVAAPTAVQTNDELVGFGGRGYGATGFDAGPSARMSYYAAQNWTDANQGTYIAWFTNTNNTSTLTEKMRLTDSGSLGLGTTSPYADFTIYAAASTAALSPQMVFSGSSTVASLANAMTNWAMGTDLADKGKFKISSSSVIGTNDRFVIDGAGLTGIGTSTPWAQLSINPIAGNGAAPSFVIGSSTATKFVVTNAGFVGIGGATPVYPLQVEPLSTAESANFKGTVAIGGGGLLPSTNSDIALIVGGASNSYQQIISGGTGGASTLFFQQGVGATTGTISAVATTRDLSITASAADLLLSAATGFGIGIGTTTPYADVTIYAAGATAAASPQLTFSGSSTVASLANAMTNWAIGTDLADKGKFKISSSSVIGTNDRFVIDGAGRVGVGTSSPSAVFSVQGNTLLSGNLNAANITATGTASTTSLIVSSAGGSAGCATFAVDGTISNTGVACGGGGAFAFTPSTNYGANVNATTTALWAQAGLFASSSSAYPTLAVAQVGAGPVATFMGGNVGVGTTTPASVLSVQGNALLSGNLNAANITATGTITALTGNITNLTVVTGTTFASITGVAQQCLQVDINGLVSGTGTACGAGAASQWTTNGSSIYYNGGNVGIGTTTPAWLTQLATSTNNASFKGGQLTLSDNNAGTDLRHWVFGSVGGNLYIGTSSNAYATSSIAALTVLGGSAVGSAGFVGIGSTTPWGMLSINPTSNIGSNPAFVIGSSSATSFIVDNDGRVGIGTTSPWAALSLVTNNAANGSTFNTPPAFLIATTSTWNSGSQHPLFWVAATTTGIQDYSRIAIGTTSPWGLAGLRDQFTVAGRIYSTWSYVQCEANGISGLGTTALSADVAINTSMCGNFGFDESTDADVAFQANAYPAYIRLTPGTQTNFASGEGGTVRTFGATAPATSSPVMEARVRIPLNTSTTTRFMVGFTDEAWNANTTTLPTNGAFFISSTTQGQFWVAAVKNQGVETRVVTTVASTTGLTTVPGSFQRFRIEVSSTTATFLIDGNVVAVISPAAGVGAGANMAPMVQATNGGIGSLAATSVSGTNAIDINYIRMWVDDPPEGSAAPGFAAAPEVPFDPIQGADIAEANLVDTPADYVPGMLVAHATSSSMVRRSLGHYDNNLVGVVSTAPSTTLGQETASTVRVGLVGRVPVIVSLENGPVHTGDRITSSSIEGVGMRAERLGKIVGIAQADFTSGAACDTSLAAQVRAAGVAVPEGACLGTVLMALEVGEDIGIATVYHEASDQGPGADKLALTADKLTLSGVASAGTFEVANTPVTGFTLGATTTVATLPSEVLTAAGTVDLYKLATYNLSGIAALAEKINAQDVRLTTLEDRVTALESGNISSNNSAISTSSLASAFNALGAFITKGFAQFGTLIADQFVAATNSAGTSSAGTVTILAGNTVAQVSNSYVLPTSKIFVTLTASTTATWYISDKVPGSFKLVLSAPQTTDISFDYFIVQTEGQIATSTPEVQSVSQSNGPDTIAPTVTLLGDNPVHLSIGGTYVEPGVRVTDNTDGNVPFETFVNGLAQEVNSSTIDTSVATTYIITYSATDKAGNTASAMRSVIVGNPDNVVEPPAPTPPPSSDVTPPTVTLMGEAAMSLTVGDTFTDPGAMATDDSDGDLSAKIVVSGTVDTATAGSYTLTYSATDAAGNTGSASRLVTVVP